MPTVTGSAVARGGGNRSRAFGTTYTAVVPTTIGSASAVDVTRDDSAALQAFIDNQPDGTRIQFQPNYVYNCNKTINFVDRNYLMLEGRGATIRATKRGNYSFVVTDATIEADRVHINSPSAPFRPLQNTVFSWYVQGAVGISQGSRIGASGYESDTRVIFQPGGNSAGGTPGSGYTMTFTSPQDRNRSNIAFQRGYHIRIANLTVQGANTAHTGFDVVLEGQANIGIAGTQDIEISRCTFADAFGDNLTLAIYGATRLPSALVHDNEFRYATRQGIAIVGLSNQNLPGGITDSRIERNIIRDATRHLVDIEPNAPGADCTHIVIANNDFLRGGLGFLVASEYSSVNIVVAYLTIDGNRVTDTLNMPFGINVLATNKRWGPIYITNNRATVNFGFGTAGGNTWSSLPRVIDFSYVDGIYVTGNDVHAQPGRGMYAVAARYSTGVSAATVHDNTGFEAGRELYVFPYTAPGGAIIGAARGTGGGRATATGIQSAPPDSSAYANGGGRASATGHRIWYGTARANGGGTATAAGIDVTANTGRAVALGGGVATIDLIPDNPWDAGGGVKLRGPGWDRTGWDAGRWDEGAP